VLLRTTSGRWHPRSRANKPTTESQGGSSLRISWGGWRSGLASTAGAGGDSRLGMADMRADHQLERLRSLHLYSFSDVVYGAVLGANGLDDDEIFADYLDNPVKALTPHKDTLLHEFIQSALYQNYAYFLDKAPDLEVSGLKSLLEEAEMECPKWMTSEKIERHLNQADRLLSRAIEIMAPSVFYLLFSDRQFLGEFQRRIATFVSSMKHRDYPNLLTRDGVAKRLEYIPTWLKAGIFYRDRGRCQLCFRDLSGLGRPVRDIHLDHIIPLAMSGSNDPTNFQLSCQGCNLSKGRRAMNQSPRFSPYW